MRTEPRARTHGALASLACRCLTALALAACLAPSAVATEAGDLVVIAGRGFDGQRFIEGPVRVVVRDGRIVTGEPGPGARVIRAPEGFVMPGMIDLRSGVNSALVTPNEEASEVTPAWRAIDAVDPASPAFARALSGGVTAVAVQPGARAVIAGLAAVVKTDPRPLRERIVREDIALLISLGFEPALGNRTARFSQPSGLHFRRPANRMGVLSEIRRACLAASGGATGEGNAVLRRATSGQLPAWFVARTDADIRTALRLQDELGLRAVLLEPHEAHRLAPAIAGARVAALVGPDYGLPRNLMEFFEGQDARSATAAILHEAGARVALVTGPSDDPAALLDRVALAIRHGLPAQTALAAVTAVPADIAGIAGRAGTLAAGADGDLLIFDGDPTSPASRLTFVIVEGRVLVAPQDPGNPTESTP